MTIPNYVFSTHIVAACGKEPYQLFDDNDKTEAVINRDNCIVAGLLTIDAVSSIAALVLGILGVLSVISMPPAASYALIGVSIAITLMWIMMIIVGKALPKKPDQ